MYSRVAPERVKELRANGEILLGVNSSSRQRQYTRIPPTERFMAKVDKQPNGCWYWTASLNNKGYGYFARVDGVKVEMAHRSAYAMFVGEIPSGMGVLHRCDTPHCVNPEHLFVGTSADNMQDCVQKWRTRSKLTAEQVEEIRNSTEKSRDLAAKFGLKSHKSILNIRHGRTFASVT